VIETLKRRAARNKGVGYKTVVFASILLIGPMLLAGCPAPSPDGIASLTGTWNGTVTYTVKLYLGESQANQYSFDNETTVTFDDAGLPDVLYLNAGIGDEVWQMTTENLKQVGDSETFEFVSGDTTTTVHATVTDVSTSGTQFSISLDIDLEFSGATTGTGTGTYEFTATVQADGSLQFESNATIDFSDAGLQISLTVEATGTLTKQ